jgi:hypothetical protein
MSGPELYTWYPLEQVISFFGARRDANSLCDGQWLIFPRTAVCLSTLGAAPKMSYFQTASYFCWVADRPYRVKSERERYSHFVPAEVVGPEAKKQRSIRLFVRTGERLDYLYAGELEPSYMQAAPGPENHGEARFELRPALPSEIWRELGGFQPGNLDFAPLDRALDRLRGQTTVDDRLDAIRELVDYWHGPIKPEDGMSDADLNGVALPRPLAWWYRHAGNRPEIMSGQNIMFRPRDDHHKYWQLSLDDGFLHFYSENQGCHFWATLPHGDDPPVFSRSESTAPWEREDISLSEHLILTCLFEAVICHAKYGAWAAWLDQDKVDEIAKTIPPIAISPWRWIGARFFAGRGAFMVAASNVELEGRPGCSVWIGAKTEHPLQFLKPLLDDRWEYVAV